LLLLVAVMTISCVDFAPQYGLRKLNLPSGEVYYFRREARGLNFDSLSLVTSSDHCREPNPGTDIIFKGLGPLHLFYRFSDDEMHLYLTTRIEVPPDFSKTKIVQHELNNGEFMRLLETHKSEGLEMVNVEIDSTLICN
jgi:hypothetical protein